MSKKILHIGMDGVFLRSFIDFLRDEFEFKKHTFLITTEKCQKSEYKNVMLLQRTVSDRLKHYILSAIKMHQSDKIVLHGLFDIKFVFLLFLMPWLLKKCYWVMWGADLYVYQLAEKNWKWKVNEFYRRPVIKNMGYLVTGTPGDVELARRWYGSKGQHVTCFNYTSNIYHPLPKVANEKSGINILTGNSADPSNNHFSIFEKIKNLVDGDFYIYCPLSYGDEEYAERVCVEGKRIFGDRFKPLKDFMDLEEYLEILANIDIAIFDHHRQQAFGNTLSLLGFGKKVYINPVSTLNGVFEGLGIKVYDSTSIYDLIPLDKKIANNNRLKVERNFSKENLLDSLKKWIG
ncbi:MAG: TDP-N-acetylfucosamine:lipid II N-acetylfucosaminyltransferase [Vibrio sp.]|uniref:TDP-N-acetylfucosamine:lipid II N-acetylfucosaminyltransferase n=1 Tax=Vibrio sp. TaxID=678 RepID=UPI003F381A27